MGELNILISLIAAEGSRDVLPPTSRSSHRHSYMETAPSFRIHTTSQTLLGAFGTISAGNIHSEHHLIQRELLPGTHKVQKSSKSHARSETAAEQGKIGMFGNGIAAAAALGGFS